MKPLAMIAAMGRNRVLGSGNDLMWHLPDDFQFFKEETQGHTIIMGRKTFDSMGKPLPKRKNLVVTKQEGLEIDGCDVYQSLDNAIAAAYETDDTPYIIGGGQIYKLALAKATRLYLTEVDFEEEGEAYFPEFNPSEWKEVSSVFHDKDERHDFSFTFKVYDRILK